jgi:hypothetical protein
MFFQVYNWKTIMTLKKTNKKKLMDVWILQQKWSCPLLVKSPKKIKYRTQVETTTKWRHQFRDQIIYDMFLWYSNLTRSKKSFIMKQETKGRLLFTPFFKCLFCSSYAHVISTPF